MLRRSRLRLCQRYILELRDRLNLAVVADVEVFGPEAAYLAAVGVYYNCRYLNQVDRALYGRRRREFLGSENHSEQESTQKSAVLWHSVGHQCNACLDTSQA